MPQRLLQLGIAQLVQGALGAPALQQAGEGGGRGGQWAGGVDVPRPACCSTLHLGIALQYRDSWALLTHTHPQLPFLHQPRPDLRTLPRQG